MSCLLMCWNHCVNYSLIQEIMLVLWRNMLALLPSCKKSRQRGRKGRRGFFCYAYLGKCSKNPDLFSYPVGRWDLKKNNSSPVFFWKKVFMCLGMFWLLFELAWVLILFISSFLYFWISKYCNQKCIQRNFENILLPHWLILT